MSEPHRPRLGEGSDAVYAALMSRKAEGLWADAWRRLKKNRMAVSGLVVTVVMSLSAILAPWISPFRPEVQQRWTGALPPWTEILSLRNEMRFAVDVRPADLEVPRQLGRVLGDGAVHRIVFEIQEEVVTPVRLVIGRGGVEQLQIRPPGEGVLRPGRLVLGEGEFLRTESDRALLPPDPLVKGEPLPGGYPVGEGARYVLKLELISRSPDARYRAEVDFDGEGVVTAVRQAGEAGVAALTVQPAQVVDVTVDGEKATQLHVLGTDQEGRDTLSRLIHGGKISLLVGITATMVSLVIGVLYGAFAGYKGGRVDGFLMRLVDILYGVPYMFLVILLMVGFGRSIIVLFIALGMVQWLTMARIVRGQVLSLREKEFVDAAITMGTSPWHILTRHLIPNTLGVVVVYTTLTVPAVILQESFLAFLGLNVEMDGKPLESWGALVNYGREALGANGEFWWLLLFPSVAMAVTLFSLNFLGDGLRDALDPQQRGRN